jgi:HPt (histidine-containing phosphotransfer) domain-containing protein
MIQEKVAFEAEKAADYARHIGRDKVDRLLRLTLIDIERAIPEIATDLQCGRLSEARRSAHLLKSSASAFGASLLVEMLDRVRTVGPDSADINTLITQLHLAYRRTKTAINDWLRSDDI